MFLHKQALYVALLVTLLSLLLPLEMRAGDTKTISLSAAEVKRIMLKDGYTVQSARLKSEAVKQNVPASKGIFDTNLNADVSHQIDKSAKSSPIYPDSEITSWEISANRKFATGTEASVGFINDRIKYSDSLTINNVPVFPPQAIYEPIIAFTISQPVLKNAGGYLDRRTVRSAELGSLATELATQREIETLVYGALADYWNLVLIRRHVIAMQKSVNFAQQFLKTTLEEFKLGTVEETDVLAAKANVLVRKDEFLATKEYERAWHENLRVKLGFGPNVNVNNKEKIPPFMKLIESETQRIDYALNNRKDYLASKRELELRNVELAMAKNERWPSMDLYSSLELNEIDTSYSRAVGSLNSPNWIVGMNFSVPLENRTARANKRKADLQRARALVALKDLENRIANSVSRNYKDVIARKTIVTQSQTALNLQVKKLRQEMKKYSLGRSSSYIIVQYQDDAVKAERANLEAWLAYKTAALDLLLAEGNLIESDAKKEENKK